ncbi:hypothetical protein [Methylobacterium sp. Leaf118]|nr:hypothetical protein [Methylobacterium sp. Leaf118]
MTPHLSSAAEPRPDLTAAAIGLVALAIAVGAPGTVIWCLFENGWL